MTTTPKRRVYRAGQSLDRLEMFMLGAMAGAALIALIVLWAA